MTSPGRQLTRAFISELVRAANEIDKLTLFERTRLFQRTLVTLDDLGASPVDVMMFSEYGRISDILSDEEASAALR